MEGRTEGEDEMSEGVAVDTHGCCCSCLTTTRRTRTRTTATTTSATTTSVPTTTTTTMATVRTNLLSTDAFHNNAAGPRLPKDTTHESLQNVNGSASPRLSTATVRDHQGRSTAPTRSEASGPV